VPNVKSKPNNITGINYEAIGNVMIAILRIKSKVIPTVILARTLQKWYDLRVGLVAYN
jgi:hypothetical protein